MPDNADNAFLARKQADSDQQVAQAYLAAHPEEAQSFGVQPQAQQTASNILPRNPERPQLTDPGTEARKARDVQLGTQAHELGKQAQSSIDTLETATKVMGGVSKGLNIVGGAAALMAQGVPPVHAIAGGALLDQAEQRGTDWVLTQARKLYGDNHPTLDAITSLVANMGIAGGMLGSVPNTNTPPAGGNLGEPPAGTILDAQGRPMPPSAAQPPVETAPSDVFYRGQESGRTGTGHFYTKDAQFANEFNEAGDYQPENLPRFTIPEDKIYRPDTLPMASNEAQMTQAIADAKAKGFSAVYVDEGKPFGKPVESVFAINKKLPAPAAGGVTGDTSPITPPAGEAGASPATDAAAIDLAQKQIAALKEARVGKTTAEEFGRPDIATTVPEAQTMREAEALRAKVEPFFGERRPPMAAHTAAFAKVYQDEAAGIRADALDIVTKGAAGEDTTAAEAALQSRFAAYAVNYANLAGTRSEMGRALQILDPLKPGNMFAADTAKLAQEIAADPNANLVQKLSAIDPERAAVMARQMGEASIQGRSVTGMIREYYMNALLSKPSTFIAKKVTGDITSYALEAPTRFIAAKIPMWGGDKVAPEEAAAFARQSVLATADAARIAKLTFENGTSAVDALGGGHNTEFESALRMPEIRGDGSGDFMSKSADLLGDVIRIPSRTMQAETDFAYVVNYRGQLGALAYRTARSEAQAQGLSGSAAGEFIQDRASKLLMNPTPDMVQGAHSLAQTNTFTQPLGPIGQGFSNTLDKLSDYIPGLGRILFPFRKVPVNLAKYAMGHSPMALLTRQFYSDVSQGGAAGQLALAKLGLGSAVSLAAAEWAMNGHITGGGPSDHTQYKNQIATGWKPYAIHDGNGNYFTYDRLSPLGEMLGMPADFVTLMGEAPQTDVEHAGVALAQTIGRNMTRQTYVETLANVNNLIDSLKSGDTMSNALSKFSAREVSGIIPAALRAEAKREDPVLRDTRGFMDTLLASVPGYSKNMPPRRDLHANPILTPPGFLANEVYPFQIGAEAHDPIADEVFKTGANLQKPPDVLWGRTPKMNDPAQAPDVGVPLDKWQKDKWQVIRASYKDNQLGTMDDALKTAMADPDYQGLANEDKAKVLEKVVLEYGNAATQLMIDPQSPYFDKELAHKYDLRQQFKALGHMPPGGDARKFLSDNGIAPAPEIR